MMAQVVVKSQLPKLACCFIAAVVRPVPAPLTDRPELSVSQKLFVTRLADAPVERPPISPPI